MCHRIGRSPTVTIGFGIESVDNSNGFLCLSKNIDDTVEKINNFINLDNNIKKQMSLMGRQKVLQFFDYKIVMKKFINEIDKILKQ